jgi:hypothetical protein
MENNLRESDRRWGGFSGKGRKGQIDGVRILYLENESII